MIWIYICVIDIRFAPCQTFEICLSINRLCGSLDWRSTHEGAPCVSRSTGSTQQTFCPPVNCYRDRVRRGEMDLSMFPWRASGRRTRGFLLGAMPARVRRSPARRVGRQARGHLLRATRARGLPAPLTAPTPFCCDLPAPLILLPKPTRPAPIPHSGNRLDGSFSSNPSSNRPPRSVRLHGGRW